MARKTAPDSPPVTRASDLPGDASPFALGLLPRRAHDRAADALVGAIRPFGLELRHFAVLIALSARGPLSQSALVAATSSDKASMVRVIDDLERAGLVTRRPVPGDRRVHAIEMTPLATCPGSPTRKWQPNMSSWQPRSSKPPRRSQARLASPAPSSAATARQPTRSWPRPASRLPPTIAGASRSSWSAGQGTRPATCWARSRSSYCTTPPARC
jgi:hypothetical protein